MSTEEKITEVEEMLNRFLRLGWGSLISVLAIAFGFGSWVSSLELRAQTATAQLINMEQDHRAFEMFKAETQNNRYTATDHNKFASAVQDSLASYDKRVTRIEDGMASVNKSLDRIEGKLGTK